MEALRPASLELSLEAAKNVEKEREQMEALWQKRLERARYATERAARQYHLVEPENRLVVRHLEKDWEEKLHEQEKLEEEYERLRSRQPRILLAQEREAIRHLAKDIPALWHAPETVVVARKEILREVVDKIVIDVMGSTERVKVDIHWAGGMVSKLETIRPVRKLEQLSYYSKLTECIKQLAGEGLKASQIAERLNREGWRPPKRREKFGKQGVKALMSRLGLTKRRSGDKERGRIGRDEWWLPELALELDMPGVTLYNWIRRGWVKARQQEGPTKRWVVLADPKEIERLRKVRKVPLGFRTRRHWVERRDGGELERIAAN